MKSIMKLGAFIMTFNRHAILRQTIESIISQTRPPDLIVVVDNGSSPETQRIVGSFSIPTLIYHNMGENVGPAGATAYGIKWLISQGCDWIYWVDDDDPPPTANLLERLLRLLDTYADCSDIGGIGAVGQRFNWITGEIERLADDELAGPVEVDVIAGNQQLILNRQMVQKVGVADERLFFGLYEPEYCLRIRKAGYKLIIDGELMFELRKKWGRVGNIQRSKLIPDDNERNMWQRYYRTRNYIFMMKNTFLYPHLARREALKALGRSFFSLMRGPRFGAHFTSLQVRGVIDGYLGRMGRTIQPKAKY